MLIELKIKEGLAPPEARRAALIELGGKEQVKEKVRDVRVGHQLEMLWQREHGDFQRCECCHPATTAISRRQPFSHVVDG
jgi:hypothetical protein